MGGDGRPDAFTPARRTASIAFAREGAEVAIHSRPAEAPDAREVIALIRSPGRPGGALP